MDTSNGARILEEHAGVLRYQVPRTLRAMRAFFSDNPSLSEIGHAVRAAHHSIDINVRAYLADLAEVQRVQPECGRGCSFCCHQDTAVSVSELLRICGVLGGSRRLDARRRALVTYEAAKGLSRKERHRRGVPCPMLDARACGIYEVRPTACRTHFSFDVQACVRAWQQRRTDAEIGIPSPTVPTAIGMAVQFGLDAALLECGLQMGMVELSAGLVLGLVPEAWEAWAEGKPVFAQASAEVDAVGAYPGLLRDVLKAGGWPG